jgi:hypothetical protein
MTVPRVLLGSTRSSQAAPRATDARLAPMHLTGAMHASLVNKTRSSWGTDACRAQTVTSLWGLQ